MKESERLRQNCKPKKGVQSLCLCGIHKLDLIKQPHRNEEIYENDEMKDGSNSNTLRMFMCSTDGTAGGNSRRDRDCRCNL